MSRYALVFAACAASLLTPHALAEDGHAFICADSGLRTLIMFSADGKGCGV